MRLRDAMVGKVRLLPTVVALLVLAGIVLLGLAIGWGWTVLLVVLAFGIAAGANTAITGRKKRAASDAQALLPHRAGAETVQVREYA